MMASRGVNTAKAICMALQHVFFKSLIHLCIRRRRIASIAWRHGGGHVRAGGQPELDAEACPAPGGQQELVSDARGSRTTAWGRTAAPEAVARCRGGPRAGG